MLFPEVSDTDEIFPAHNFAVASTIDKLHQSIAQSDFSFAAAPRDDEADIMFKCVDVFSDPVCFSWVVAPRPMLVT